jgi:hypothetical protein
MSDVNEPQLPPGTHGLVYLGRCPIDAYSPTFHLDPDGNLMVQTLLDLPAITDFSRPTPRRPHRLHLRRLTARKG